MKVQISGLGVYEYGNEYCIFSGRLATGYISLNSEDEPCCLSILGAGLLGEYVEVPKKYSDEYEVKQIVSAWV